MSDVTIYTNSVLSPEESYILKVVLEDFWGLSWCHSIYKEEGYCLRNNFSNVSVWMPRLFLDIDEEHYYSGINIPNVPLYTINLDFLKEDLMLVDYCLPVIFGTKEDIQFLDGEVKLPVDIFGSIFFMLSRYEEMFSNVCDEHGRYSANESLAYKAGYLERPIVDEYLNLLWYFINKNESVFNRPIQPNKLNVTCDLDLIYSPNSSLKSVVYSCFKLFNSSKGVGFEFKVLLSKIKAFFGYYEDLSYLDNVYWMMGVNEKFHNNVTFYIFTNSTNNLDAWYSLSDSIVAQLILDIADRGHSLGIHTSYDSYLDKGLLEKQKFLFERKLKAMKINEDKILSRQHYLRWNTPKTGNNLDLSGYDVDSTLGYANHPGFRCGTGREFQMYNLLDRVPLNIKQRPLVIMESTYFESKYLGLQCNEITLEKMLLIKDRALEYSGECTILWHNSSFETPEHYKVYENLIKK